MATPALLIGLDNKGKVVQIRVGTKTRTKQVKFKKVATHKCAKGEKPVVIKLHFCPDSKFQSKKTGGKKTQTGQPGKTTPPCCMTVGGQVFCWPPCV